MPVNVETILSERVVPALNALSFTDLLWWTKTTLYEWANEAALRMAKAAAGIVDTASQSLVTSQGAYTLPDRTLSIIHVSAATKTLRPANARDLEARSTNWRAVESANITHYVREDQGLTALTLHPKPATGLTGLLSITRHVRPAPVSEGSPSLPWPEILGGYIGLRVIAAARTAEVEAKMPEAAAIADQLAGVFEQAAANLWGGVQ
jgi:hypothetical protein